MASPAGFGGRRSVALRSGTGHKAQAVDLRKRKDESAESGLLNFP